MHLKLSYMPFLIFGITILWGIKGSILHDNQNNPISRGSPIFIVPPFIEILHTPLPHDCPFRAG